MSDDEALKSLKPKRMITAATNAKSKQIAPTTMSGREKKKRLHSHNNVRLESHFIIIILLKWAVPMIFIATSVHSICVYEKDRSPLGPCVQLRIVICNNIEIKERKIPSFAHFFFGRWSKKKTQQTRAWEFNFRTEAQKNSNTYSCVFAQKNFWNFFQVSKSHSKCETNCE